MKSWEQSLPDRGNNKYKDRCEEQGCHVIVIDTPEWLRSTEHRKACGETRATWRVPAMTQKFSVSTEGSQ